MKISFKASIKQPMQEPTKEAMKEPVKGTKEGTKDLMIGSLELVLLMIGAIDSVSIRERLHE